MLPLQSTSEASLWISPAKQSWEIFSEQETLRQASFLRGPGKTVSEMIYTNCAEYIYSRKVNKYNCKINVVSLTSPEHAFQSAV